MYGYVDVNEVFRLKKIYTAFHQSLDENYYFDGEQHNFWELVIVTKGEIGVTAGSDVFILQKGQAVIHPPMEFHRLWSEKKTLPEIVVFTFSADNVPCFSSRIFEIKDVETPNKILSDIKLSFVYDNFNITGIKNTFSYQLTVKNLESFILDTMSQRYVKTTVAKSVQAKNYAMIVNVLENNIDKHLNVYQIAKMCNMSEVNLKKTFTRYAGIGIMQYFNQMKVTTAIDMIKNGASVYETAHTLGFLTPNYMSTVFKRITGKPPSFYKNMEV